MTNEIDRRALAYVAQKVGYKNLHRYESRANFIFKNIQIEGLRVLEIGCGIGAFALWSALHKASFVLGIEPEADGSTSQSLDVFQSLISDLKLDNKVSSSSACLQDISILDKAFDLAIMYNVINHIDENAVSSLLSDKSSEKKYISILKHLWHLLSPGAYVIVADCGRRNFWQYLGLRSPLAASINWHKHQEPEVWINIFRKAGFALHDLRWSPLFPFGKLSSNYFVQFITASHFVLRFRKKI